MEGIRQLISSSDNELRIRGLNELNDALNSSTSTTETASITDQLDTLTDLVKLSAKSSNPNVNSAALAVVETLFRCVPDAPSNALRRTVDALLPVDKLADAKEKTRSLALAAISRAAQRSLALPQAKEKDSVWSTVLSQVQEHAFLSKNAKAREQSVLFARVVRSFEPPAPLKPFATLLLPLLNDQDQSVRAAALDAVIALWTSPSVTDAARSDLQKELAKSQVHQKTKDAITSALFEQSSASDLPASAFPSQTDASAAKDTLIRPAYVASAKDLTDEFEKMRPAFEGKETEHNWSAREKNVARIRSLLQGKAHDRFPEQFFSGIQSLTEGILKAVSSLRTTLATSSLSLLSELSLALKRRFDPLLDPVLAHLLPMAAQTKKIVATASQSTVSVLLANSSFHMKTLHQLQSLSSDKSAAARAAVAQHLSTFVKAHAADDSKPAIESTGGLEIVKTCVAKALVDANPAVREAARVAFWTVANEWPATADFMKKGLDANGLKLLDKAKPSTANVVESTTTSSSVETSDATAPTKVSKGGRPSIRELIAQKKREGMRSVTDSPTASASMHQTPTRKVSEPAAATPASPSVDQDSPARSPMTSNKTARGGEDEDVLSNGIEKLTLGTSSTPQPKRTQALLAIGGTDAFRDSPDKGSVAGGSLGSGQWWSAKNRLDSQTDDRGLPKGETEIDVDVIENAVARLERVNDEEAIQFLLRASSQCDRESIELWSGRDRLKRIIDAIASLLLSFDAYEPSMDRMLLVLQSLVDHQGRAFQGGHQKALYVTLMRLRSSSLFAEGQPQRMIASAIDAITQSAVDQFDVTLSLEAMCEACNEVSTNDSTAGLSVAMPIFQTCFSSLPFEDVADTIPECRPFIFAALNDSTSGQLRQGAVMAISAGLYRSLLNVAPTGEEGHDGDEQRRTTASERVFGLLEQDGFTLRPDQKELLMYYFAKQV